MLWVLFNHGFAAVDEMVTQSTFLIKFPFPDYRTPYT